MTDGNVKNALYMARQVRYHVVHDEEVSLDDVEYIIDELKTHLSR